MTAAVLDTTEALLALEPEWDALWRATPGATPFQSPQWLLPWWHVFGTDRPRIGIWRTEGRLTGLLPAYILPGTPAKLLPIGAGITDTLGPLGTGTTPMLHAVLARAAVDGIDRCDLIETPPNSPLRTAPAPAGWTATWSDISACPVLTLPGVPAAQRRKLRMSRNRAERAGGYTVHHATTETLARDLATLITLHQSRWTGNGEPGVLADPAVNAFHHRAAPGLLASGLLRLAVLHLNDAPAAVALTLLDRTRIHFYLSGYDTAQAFTSPGTILLGALLDQAEAEGRTEAHFLRGREAYKYAWGAVDRWNATGAYRR